MVLGAWRLWNKKGRPPGQMATCQRDSLTDVEDYADADTYYIIAMVYSVTLLHCDFYFDF